MCDRNDSLFKWKEIARVCELLELLMLEVLERAHSIQIERVSVAGNHCCRGQIVLQQFRMVQKTLMRIDQLIGCLLSICWWSWWGRWWTRWGGFIIIAWRLQSQLLLLIWLLASSCSGQQIGVWIGSKQRKGKFKVQKLLNSITQIHWLAVAHSTFAGDKLPKPDFVAVGWQPRLLPMSIDLDWNSCTLQVNSSFALNPSRSLRLVTDLLVGSRLACQHRPANLLSFILCCVFTVSLYNITHH